MGNLLSHFQKVNEVFLTARQDGEVVWLKLVDGTGQDLPWLHLKDQSLENAKREHIRCGTKMVAGYVDTKPAKR